MSGNFWIVLGIIGLAFSAFAIPYGFHLKSTEKKNVSAVHSNGDFSPAISAGDNSQISVTYTIQDEDLKNAPSYEFYYQKMKNKPADPEGYEYYELGFKNITKKPLLNFVFSLYFNHPVDSIIYDAKRSSAQMFGGDELNKEKTKFNWLVNQIMEDDWIVFIVKTKNDPSIAKVSTKLIGKFPNSNKLIPADPNGI